MSVPLRIQRKRKGGWMMPANTVSVTRPGPFGNPYYPGCGLGFGNISAEGVPGSWPLRTPADMVRHFKEHMRPKRLHEPRQFFADFVIPLRGKNLSCWCSLCPKHEAAGGKPLNEECSDCSPCHVDPLGEIVNTPLAGDRAEHPHGSLSPEPRDREART